MKALAPFPQSPAEETANSLIHGIGTLLAIVGLVFLTIRSRGLLGGQAGGAIATASYALFAGTMVCMFLASTLYHAARRENIKRSLRVLDHCSIYLLIAGTCTPFCLTALKGTWGWTLFGLEWGMALAGITLHSLHIKALKKIEVAAYLLMGWAIVAGWFALVRSVSKPTLVLLIAGGVLYTLGVFWYRKKNVFGTHVVWHAFVLAGAACHWASVWSMS
ncbi:MAG: hemolysin III family protein [Spirochaetia bacterium]|nr:hemolysin III family protein [Spirochaetia bacterium]